MSPPPYQPLPSAAAGPWFVTPHAVLRFAQYALGWHGSDEIPLPEPLYQCALAGIIREGAAAHVVRSYPPKEGHGAAVLWRGPKPRRLRYVVAAAVEAGRTLPALLTVLPTFDARRIFRRV